MAIWENYKTATGGWGVEGFGPVGGGTNVRKGNSMREKSDRAGRNGIHKGKCISRVMWEERGNYLTS